MPESSDRTTECGTGSESTFRTAVAAEVERLTSPAARRSKSDRFLAAGVLLLFGLGLAMARWPMFTFWDALLTPLVALLLQEVGSFTAMRLLGYRELPGGALIGKFKRIPRRDAAAGGRHFDEPGWKVASVALAGQLPGVALGIGGLVWVLSGEHEVPKWIPGASLLMLVFASLQLLPFRPAGWRVLRVVLASRWPLFCSWFVFVFLAIVFLLPLLGWLLLGWREMLVWSFAFGIMAQAKSPPVDGQFGLTDRLLRAGYRPCAGADDRISRADSDFLVAQIQEFEPKFDQPRGVAEATVELYERLNHKPPGLALSAVFLLAQLVIILLGAVGASALGPKIFSHSESESEYSRLVWVSADGTRIATASSDNTARVWDAATGEELAVLEGHGDGDYR